MAVSSEENLSRRAAGLVFTIGLATALLWTLVVFPRFSPIEQVFDLNGFGQIGEHVWQGDGFSAGYGPTIRRAPLYPFLIAGVFKIFGFDGAHRQASYTPVIVLQCFFAAFTCLAAFCIANRLFGRKVAITAGLLCALWPQCLRYIGAIDVEATMTLLITLMTLTTLRLYQEPSVKNGSLAGLVIGLAVLTKPLPLLFPLVIFALFLLRRRRTREPIPFAPMGACVAVMALVCLPWILRNHVVSQGRYHGISSNASGEFLRGFVVVRPEFAFLRTKFQGNWDWQANLYEDELLKREGSSFFATGTNAGQAAPMGQSVDNALRKDQIEGRVAKEMVFHHPLTLVRKFAIQLFTFWYLVETPSKSILVGLFALIALGLAIVGWGQARRDGIDIAPVVATVLYFNLLYALILALARYSMPVFPSLLTVSAYGAWAALAGRRVKATGEPEHETADREVSNVARAI